MKTLRISDLKATAAIQTAWLDGSTEECTAIAAALAAYLNCNKHSVYAALTNLFPLVLTSADVNGDI